MTPTILKVNGEVLDVKPKNGTGFELEELQKIVDGLFDIVYLSNSQIMVVNDEGAINGMPYNEKATIAFMMTRGFIQPIYGNVLVCPSEMVK